MLLETSHFPEMLVAELRSFEITDAFDLGNLSEFRREFSIKLLCFLLGSWMAAYSMRYQQYQIS